MRVLLIQPYWLLVPEEVTTPPEPLALEYLASMIKDEHEVCIFDAIVGDEYPSINRNKFFIDENGTKFVHYGVDLEIIKNKIKTYKPEVVGITAPFFSQAKPVKEICRIVKMVDRNIKVIVGGSYPSAFKDHFLQLESNVDIIVIGEGEITFKELIDKNLKNLDQIHGIAFRQNETIIYTPLRQLISDLDSIPFPARDIAPYKSYAMTQRLFFWDKPFNTFLHKSRILNTFVSQPIISHLHDAIINYLSLRFGWSHQKIPRGYVLTTRGCPMNCSFCVVHHVWGHKLRMRSYKNVLDEIKLLMKQGVRHIEFVDDNFNISKKRTIEICKALEKLKITWRPSSGVYVQSLDREVLTWMKKSGCDYLTIAIESGNQNTLRNIIDKKIDLKHVINILKICNEIGIETEGFFILGLPGETKKDMIETIKFAATCGLDRARLYAAVPFPGTRLYNECIEKGILTENYDLSKLQVTNTSTNVRAALIKTDEFSPEEVIKLREIGYKILKEKNFEKYKKELESV